MILGWEEVVCLVVVSFILVFKILRVLDRLRWFNCRGGVLGEGWNVEVRILIV